MPKINIWQINLQHSKAASDHLISEVAKAQTDTVILIQEPYLFKEIPTLKIPNSHTFYSGKNNRSILIVPRYITSWFMHNLSCRDFTTCLIQDSTGKKILLVSGYMDINYKDEEMFKYLDKIHDFAKNNNYDLIIGLDSNAHSTLWSSESNNVRGNSMDEWILQNQLSIMNQGQIPTFVGTRGSTIIDITLTNRTHLVHDWMVNPNDQMSDHRRLEFSLDFEYRQTILTRSLNNADWEKFRKILQTT